MAMRSAAYISCLAGFCVVGLMAQVPPEYQVWMRSMQPTLTAIRNASDNQAAADAATRMAETFDKVAGYWKGRRAADAVSFAETARDAAKAIALGTGEKAANLEKIQAQCGACHAVYRADNDPDRKVISGGKIPPGWSVRPDRGTRTSSISQFPATFTILRWVQPGRFIAPTGQNPATSNFQRG